MTATHSFDFTSGAVVEGRHGFVAEFGLTIQLMKNGQPTGPLGAIVLDTWTHVTPTSAVLLAVELESNPYKSVTNAWGWLQAALALRYGLAPERIAQSVFLEMYSYPLGLEPASASSVTFKNAAPIWQIIGVEELAGYFGGQLPNLFERSYPRLNFNP